MYARRPSQPRPRTSQSHSFPAPVSGWISNRALATPGAGPAQGAFILDNFFPRSTGVVLRRGSLLYATLGDGEGPVRSVFSYNVGNNRKLFGASDDAIYEITSVEFPSNAAITDEESNRIVTENGDYFGWSSTGDPLMAGFTGGNWITVQFATTGGTFLLGVNGEDDGFIYDGENFWPNYAGGLWRIPVSSEIAPFTVGSEVTGATSGATATVWRVDDDSIVVRDVDFPPREWTMPYVGGSGAFTEQSTVRGEVSKAFARITGIAPGLTTWTLSYDGGTVAFADGDTVTGATSGATGIVVAVAGSTASGTLTIRDLTGTFQDDEVLNVSGAARAVANGKASSPILTGTLTLQGLTGEFVQGEPIRDGSGGSAVVEEPQTFTGGGSFQDGEQITDTDGGEATVNGDYFSVVPGVTFPDGFTTADMSFVWAFKNRLWFIERDSLNAYYTAQVDAIGGDIERFPLNGVFGRGGSLMFGATWSLEGSLQGGISEQNIFVTSEGEVAVYQGLFPGSADSWSKVGTYRIGTPLGNRAFIRGGGDIAVSTSVGLVPLSKAIELDVTSLNVATVSYNIADAWSNAYERRKSEAWQAELWPEQKMAVIAPPVTLDDPEPVVFVSNTETGAWGRFTGWDVRCMEVFEGRMFFGSVEGKIYIANIGGTDDGAAYTGSVLPLYDDLGNPSSLKVPKVGRAVVKGTTRMEGSTTFQSDYNQSMPAAPPAVGIATVANLWGSGIWGQSVWGGSLSDVMTQDWVSLGGTGYAISVCYQVTSGNSQPLDAELVRIEMSYTTAEIVT